MKSFTTIWINYIPLYFTGSHSDAAAKEIENSNVKVLYEDDENRRTKLDDKVVKKHLRVGNLDQLLVIDQNQNVIDTLRRKDYEYYEGNIESKYIASYSSETIKENHVIISSNGFKNRVLRKSPNFQKDSVYVHNLIVKNSFTPDNIYSFGHIIYHNDTISFLSFGNYKAGKECLYLLRNSVPVDSVINDFVISSMTPVPIATDKELVYVSSVYIPETDNIWNYLTGIDVESYKFKFYDRNRMEIKSAVH